MNRDFWKAVSSNDVKGARAALNGGADVDIRSVTGGEALYTAVQRNHSFPLIQLLVERAANPNFMGWENNTLSYAVKNDRADVVELLLKAGADPNATPPHCAAILEENILSNNRNRDRITYLLTESGADMNREFTHGYRPFFYAIIYDCHARTLDAMVRHGADWREKDGGARHLKRAFGRNDVEAAQFLVDLGADTSHVEDFNLRKLRHDESRQIIRPLPDGAPLYLHPGK